MVSDLAPPGRIERPMTSVGPVIRVGPNEVSILDAGACKAIYAAGSGFRKTEFYVRPLHIAWAGMLTAT
jgi:hypothetical protein